MSPIGSLCVAGYRSLLDVRLSLGQLTVVTGPNGSGKSSLYRALRLLGEVARTGVAPALAQEGGLPAVLWAGPESLSRAMREGRQPVQGTVRSQPISLRLGFSSADYGFAVDLGLPPPVPRSRFSRDPEIKLESLWTGPVLGRANAVAERAGPSARLRDQNGRWVQVTEQLAPSDSMLTQCADSRDGYELLLFRETMRRWRFYDHLRTDREAPSRRPQIGTRTAALAGDGSDLAAAVATIEETGQAELLASAIDDAFPGSRLEIVDSLGWFEIRITQPGLLRPLLAADLSDGTLRYLLLCAALLTLRPPPLMVFNEPETSLHPDLLAPLARLLVAASRQAQIIVVSHAEALAALLREAGACEIRLSKELGATEASGDQPAWFWPRR